MCVKNCCFCCLVFVFIWLVGFYFYWVFHAADISLKKVWVCPNSLIYYTTDVHHPHSLSLWKTIFYHFFFFFLFAFTYIYLCESFTTCKNLLFFARIFLNPSYLWESLFIYDHLWGSFTAYFCFLQCLWK